MKKSNRGGAGSRDPPPPAPTQWKTFIEEKRSLGDPHGRAGVEPGLSEDLTYELRGSVEDLWLAVETGGGGDVTGDPHDPRYAVQASGFRRCGRPITDPVRSATGSG